MKKNNQLPQYLIMIVIIFLFINTMILGEGVLFGSQDDAPFLHYDLVFLNAPEPDLSRCNLYIKIRYDELSFIKEDSLFRAKYEITVVVNDKDNFQVDGDAWEEEVKVYNFQETNSRQLFSTTYEQFDLKPAAYEISIGFTDLNSNNTNSIKQKIELFDFEKTDLSVSEVTFVRDLKVDSLGVKSFVPEIGNYIVDLSKELYAYFEIYSKIETEQVFDVNVNIVDSEKEKIYENSYKRKRDGFRTLEYFPMPRAKLNQGQYTLYLDVTQKLNRFKTIKKLHISWAGMPSSVEDIDLAIDQVKYISDKDEWNKLKNAEQDERLDEFKKFWKKRDPSPGTPANERMEEYFNRVAYANANFGGFRDGWKTDRGMIFIIFGPPSDIERHPFESGTKPYEVWYYYTINRHFIFMDETGFGDYRLLTRSWQDWRNLIK